MLIVFIFIFMKKMTIRTTINGFIETFINWKYNKGLLTDPYCDTPFYS